MKFVGYTIIQTMIFLIAISLLASITLPYLTDNTQAIQNEKALKQMEVIHSALDAYFDDNGTYPTTEQSLQALIQKPTLPPLPKHYRNGGYLKNLPKDPWGHAYHYQQPGKSGLFDLYAEQKNQNRRYSRSGFRIQRSPQKTHGSRYERSPA